jgi:hypothetical protein
METALPPLQAAGQDTHFDQVGDRGSERGSPAHLRAAVRQIAKAAIACDPYPLFPRVRRWRGILAKLDPESAPEQSKPRPSPATQYKPSLLAQRKARQRLRRG